MEHYKKYIIYECLLNIKYQYYGTLQTVDYLRMSTKYKISVLCNITKSLEIQNRGIETRHR
jgi:hypothetical protein